jgi:hypothetical protein
MNEQPNLPTFGSSDGGDIRKVWHNDEWYFSVIDMLAELLGSDHKRAKSYWSTLKQRLKAEGNESVTKCDQLKLAAADGKKYRQMLSTHNRRSASSNPSPRPKLNG